MDRRSSRLIMGFALLGILLVVAVVFIINSYAG